MPTEISQAKRLLFNALGIAVSVIPVSVAIFSYFPLWISRNDASFLSGISLLLICLAIVPLFKYLKQFWHSPSAPLMWFLAFILFFLLSRIASEMTVISFVGFVSNLVGSVCFRISKRYDGREE
jgi:hypothetical protein